MSDTNSFIIWIVSFLFLALILFSSYKISYIFGIKKALYRTTYILLSVMFAFICAPLINDELFSLDLSQFNIVLTYKDREFYTLIDYLEEVIVHNEFLNDMYNYFPSLKDLLMDFPQVLLVPLTYVALFFVFMIIWMPLYLYLSYKRKRRILYDRVDKKSHKVWAGVLGCVQTIFIISLVLSPLNGISRIYKNATNNTLKNKNTSLCDEYTALDKYKKYCDIIEFYNSTVFSTIGGNDTISDHVFDSLTRISYDDGSNTSLSDEAALIIKSGIVLAQSELLDSVLSSSDSIPIEVIIKNKLSDEDIDIIVDTLSNSKYSEDVLLDLSVIMANTLNDLMQVILNDENFVVDYTINKNDTIEEIKVILKALTLLSNTSLLNDLIVAMDKIVYFVEEVPENRRDDKLVFAFINDLVDTVDVYEFASFIEFLFQSKIFNKVIPYIMDKAFGYFGFNFVSTDGDIIKLLDAGVYFGNLMNKYNPNDFFELIEKVNDEELEKFGEIIDYAIKAPESQGFVKFIVNLVLYDMGIEVYFHSDILAISNWKKEVYVLKEICFLGSKVRNEENIDVDDVKMVLSHEDSQLTKLMISLVKQNPSFFLGKLMLMLGK